MANLGQWLELAAAGQDIRISKGTALVELRPVSAKNPAQPRAGTSPREALHQLQAEARLTPEQARNFLEELRGERLAAEARRPI